MSIKFCCYRFCRTKKKNNQLEDDKRNTPVYVNHVEEKKFETLSALMYTIFVWNVIEKLHGNQLIWVYIYKKKTKTKNHTIAPPSLGRWSDDSTVRWRWYDYAMFYRSIVIASLFHRAIDFFAHALFLRKWRQVWIRHTIEIKKILESSIIPEKLSFLLLLLLNCQKDFKCFEFFWYRY